MTTLKVGIAGYEEMKPRTMRIARGEPSVWFTSTESFAKGSPPEIGICCG